LSGRAFGITASTILITFRWNFSRAAPFTSRDLKESKMNSIVWLVGAVVIVIAVLNLVGFA
jgi:heme/copper-type cytochrome/quinol oxidase subunit 2